MVVESLPTKQHKRHQCDMNMCQHVAHVYETCLTLSADEFLPAYAPYPTVKWDSGT